MTKNINTIFFKIIQEICYEENINYKILSKDWITMLEKDGKTRFISGFKFDLNSHGIGNIIDDKYGMYEVLKAQNIPVIEHKIVYNKTNNNYFAIGCNTYEYVKDYFTKHNNHIILKANKGTCGRNVFNITDINEINTTLDKLFIKKYSISMCPFYNIKHEYRAIMLNGECKLIYAKHLPTIIGDGKKTIKQLLIEFNNDYFINRLNNPIYDRILAKNETFTYNWKFNLSQGSIAKKIDNKELKDKLINIAKKTCKKINLKFGSIDIIQTTNNDILVLEINSGVMLENYIKQNPDEYMTAKNIYKEAIKGLFKE